MARRSTVFLAIALMALGCEGTVVRTDTAPGGRAETACDGLACPSADEHPGFTVVRRLTNEEYRYTVEDLLGVDTSVLSELFPPESAVDGFRNTASALRVEAEQVDAFSKLAEPIAAEMDVAALYEGATACTVDDASCRTGFLESAGLALFRRPMDDGEIARFGRLFDVVADEGDDFDTAARLVVRAMLQAPQFLYRIEARPVDDIEAQRRLEAPALATGPNASLDGARLTLEAGGQATASTPLAPGAWRIAFEVAQATAVEAPSALMVKAGDQSKTFNVHGDGEVTLAAWLDPSSAVEQIELSLASDAPSPVSIEGLRVLGPRHVVDDDAVEGVANTVDSWAMASRLSYLIWRSAPDAWLHERAAADALRTEEEIVAAADRMLDDPKAARGIRGYALDWLRLHELDTAFKDPELYPEFDDALAEAMQEETLRLFEHVALESDGADLLEVFSAGSTFATPELAALYGLESRGEGWQQYEYGAGTSRRGVLTHASLMTVLSDGLRSQPVTRGVFVLSNFLCTPLAPPDDLDVEEGSDLPSPDATQRERIEILTQSPECQACHASINPFGFAFEQYDAIGRFITEDEFGNPLDASGAVQVGGAEQSFEDAVGLVGHMVEDERAQTCLSRKFFQFALGRPIEGDDREDLGAVHTGFTEAGRTYESLILAIAASPQFRFRLSY